MRRELNGNVMIPPNETHVHPRTPSVKSSVGKAPQSGRSAADRESARDAERTVKSE